MVFEFKNFMLMEGKTITKASAAVKGPAELNVQIELEDGTSCSLWFKLNKNIEDLDTEIRESFHALWESSGEKKYDKKEWNRMMGLLLQRGIEI